MRTGPLKYLTKDGLDCTGTDATTPISQIGKLKDQNKKLAVNLKLQPNPKMTPILVVFHNLRE